MVRFVYLTLFCWASVANALESDDLRKYVRDLGGVEEFVRITAEKLAKNLPQQIDSETSLLQAQAVGKTLGMTYQLTNIKTMTEKGRRNLRNDAIEMMEKKLCTNDFGKLFIGELGMKYLYIYLASSGETLFMFEINKKNCANYR